MPENYKIREIALARDLSEREVVIQALEASDKLATAAARLGITRQALIAAMRRLDVQATRSTRLTVRRRGRP